MKKIAFIFIIVLFLGGCSLIKSAKVKASGNPDRKSSGQMDHSADIFHINPTKDLNSPTGMYIPRDLDDCFKELEKMLNPDLIRIMKQGTEEDMIKYHFGLGTWMRDYWGLWGGSRLAKYFNQMGIKEPDDMSGIILETFWCHLNSQPLRLDDKIRNYQEFYKPCSMLETVTCTKCGRQFDYLQWVRDEQSLGRHRCMIIHHCASDQNLWIFEMGKGWYQADDNLKNKFEQEDIKDSLDVNELKAREKEYQDSINKEGYPLNEFNPP